MISRRYFPTPHTGRNERDLTTNAIPAKVRLATALDMLPALYALLGFQALGPPTEATGVVAAGCSDDWREAQRLLAVDAAGGGACARARGKANGSQGMPPHGHMRATENG